MTRGLAGLTHVTQVRPCKKDVKKCCAWHRGSGPGTTGDFEKLCQKEGLEVPGLIAIKHKQPADVPVQGLEGNMARRKRHAALAEYGEPFGDVGFITDLLDTRDLKDFGVVAASGMVTAAVVPKVVALLNKVSVFGKFLPYVKGAAGVLGGLAMYKYLGRRVPAKYRDAVVASSAVMAGLGAATIAHELLDKPGLKGIHGLGDLFPVNLGLVGPAEDQLLAALQNVEDQIGADMDPSFGDVFSMDASIEPEMFNYGVQGLDADVDPEQSWALTDSEGFGELDASIVPQDSLDYGDEVDLDVLQMVAAQ